MTLDQLRIFLAVAELNHVTLAAQRLNMTQSAVSGALKALEERHGVSLFDRVGRGIRLNATGQALCDKARTVLAAVKDAEALLDDLNQLQRGSLTIHASQTITSNWLPRHLVAFQALYPRIAIEARVGNTVQCIAAVQNGLCDLAFVEGEASAPFLKEEIVAWDHLAIISATNHPLAQRRPRFIKDLQQQSWILRERGSGTRSTFETALARVGVDVQELNVVLELWTNEAICSAVERSRHLGVVPWIVAEPLMSNRRLAAHRYDEMIRPYRVMRHQDRHISAAASRFVEVVRGAIANPSR